MSRIIMLIPTDTNVGLTSVTLGVIHAMEQKGINLSFFKPIAQPRSSNDHLDATIKIIHANSNVPFAEPLVMDYAKSLLRSNQQNILMEEIIANYRSNIKKSEVVLIEGLVPTRTYQFTYTLNYEIAQALNAEIVFVLSLDHCLSEQLKERIELILLDFGSRINKNITGVILNKLNAPVDKQGYNFNYLFDISGNSKKPSIDNIDLHQLSKNSPLPLLGCIPWNIDLIAIRAIDIAKHIDATIIHEGEIQTRRIRSIVFYAHNLLNMLEYFHSESLLVASADRSDLLLAACLSSINSIKIGAILFTDGYNLDSRIKQFFKQTFQTDLPVFIVKTNIWQTSINLQRLNLEIPADDYSRVKKIQNYIANHINDCWIRSLSSNPKLPNRTSPAEFRYKLIELARKADKHILLPEGNEPRIIKAASICAERSIANCILLGDPNEIYRIAEMQGIVLTDNIKIINPELVRDNHIYRLIELRKSKGITEKEAREMLKDNVVLGTMMLEQDEVDGIVSGIMHTTANTIRPSLQLIKTTPTNSLVSSIFFMLLPEQVLVYGDCAINPNPNAEQLSEIAIQSADSAAAFGIEPRVAMISYSTGNSGTGSNVEKVREATRLVQKKRPDIIIDGPMQYDAAIIADVAILKAPNSPVAGRATVLIFPDLNTGNTTYKAVQRSAHLNSIGPMLQGMRKPVNDLSRGALVDDIVYTIALTAIQSTQIKNFSSVKNV